MVSLATARHDSLQWRHIKSHCGQPDNEAADSIAHALCCGWSPNFRPPKRLAALMAHPLRDWAWLQCNPSEELPDLACLIATPPKPPDGDATLWQVQHQQHEAEVQHIRWRFGSANVRTMQYTERYHSEKVIVLREQLVSMAFDVFAFQECRGRWDQCVEDDYFIRVCAAGNKGQGGLELWLRKGGAFKGTGLGEITKEHLVAWHVSSTVLGVACHHPALVCTIVVIYAPQAGRSHSDVADWWHNLDKILQRRPNVGPVMMLGDANAHVGSITSPAIGDLSPDFEDAAGEGLRHICDKHGLLLPATHAAYHSGSSATFVGPWKVHSRVDYIAVPIDWEPGIESSVTCPQLDLLTDGEDHVAITLEMTLQVADKSTTVVGRVSRYDRTQARSDVGQSWLKSLSDFIPSQPWADDVNKHWHNLRTAVLDACGQWFPKPKRKRRQLYMSEQLWQIVEDRKELASRLKKLGLNSRLRSLAGFFALWCQRMDQWRELCVQEVLADQVCAFDLLQYQQLSRRFHAIRKQERKLWITQGAQQLREGLSQGSFSQWCKLLKPKRAIQQKSRPHGRLPGVRNTDGSWMSYGQNVSLMWQRHFGNIENADDGTPANILSKSIPSSLASIDRLLEMPTIYDVERAMRLSNPYKAPGPDQIGAEIWRSDVPGLAKRCYALFLKSGLRSQWVAEFAGGDLVPLHKKGDTTQPSNYRAILLEPTLGRIFSRAWRTRLVSALEMVQAPLQFGGHRVVSIEVAHLAVRNAQQISHARRTSCAMIFADIKSAFYVVAKPFLTGVDTSPDDVVALFEKMGLPQDTLAAFVEAIEEGVVIPEVGRSNHLQSVVAAMLKHTWAKVPGADRYMLPRTGSRPGDPLADALFGFVMAKALHAIARRYDAEGLCTTWNDDFPIAPAVVWVDDAIFHVEASASQLQEKTTCALRILHEEMLRVGLCLNYGQGKTEVLMCFWGSKAKGSSQHFFQQMRGQFHVCNEFDGVFTVRAVPHYKYLGGFITKTLSLLPELRVRRAQMHQQLHGIKHCALADESLPIEKRRSLLQSLGLSVSTLHSGTWRPLSKGEWDSWHGTTTAAYQHLHKRQCDGGVVHRTTLQLAVAAEAPLPHALLYLRRLRVMVQLCRLGVGPVLDGVFCNYRLCGSTSWLHGLCEAVEWAKADADDRDWIGMLDQLTDENAWSALQPQWWQLKKLVKKVERLHLMRNRMCQDLMHFKEEHDGLLRDLGWTAPHVETEEGEPKFEVACSMCDYKAGSYAALAVHENRRHGVVAIARKFAKSGVCTVCRRSFHTRPRAILHLQYGTTKCLLHVLRHGTPLSDEECAALDRDDVKAGVALHQKGLKDGVAQFPFFEADEDGGVMDLEPPTAEELQRWQGHGSLPRWLTGRGASTRQRDGVSIVDTIELLSDYERKWFQDASSWKPPSSSVPRPLARNKLYFLIFFSGHRRHRDLVAWLEWSDRIQPIPIDLAIDEFYGDARRGGLWADLIKAGLVAGGHFGPPCESYTDARWLEVLEETWKRCPRPLRTMAYGWGLPRRGRRELLQTDMGNQLMWLSFSYMFLLAQAGGCATLEHPRGQAPKDGRFSVWTSSLVKRALQSPEWDVTSFLQGPLGVPYAKPTRLLHLRLPHLPQAIFSAYDPGWRRSETLGGQDTDGSWKTTKAKAYPDKMNRVLSEVYLKFVESSLRLDYVAEPPQLQAALAALTGFWDPYVDSTRGAVMARDFHG